MSPVSSALKAVIQAAAVDGALLLGALAACYAGALLTARMLAKLGVGGFLPAPDGDYLDDQISGASLADGARARALARQEARAASSHDSHVWSPYDEEARNTALDWDSFDIH